MQKRNLAVLHDAINKICPIDGVSIGRIDDKKTWRVDFKSEVTKQQQKDVEAIIASFDAERLTKDPPTFLARDFFAQLSVSDFSKIKAAVASNDGLGLLWASLQAQGEAPIAADSERFLAGWGGLKQALGEKRAGEIAGALKIPSE